MTADADKIRSIFLAAVESYPPEQWQAYLDEACASDDDLRKRVEALLRGHTAYNGLLDRPVPSLESCITEGLGSVIGPYKLMEQIGEGGMGLVFIAEQQQPVRRKVALKVIKPGMDTRQVVARFEAERQALALMEHPNIARVLDGGSTSSGRPYFVMELVKGVPITEYCDRNRLAPRQRLELFIDVCQAVQHAHQRGIIHRDLKPSNVLITSHDGTPVVKVIDFGVAKSIGQRLTDKTVYTQHTQLVGTPLYMSPEQAGQSGLDVDTRTDIFALGVLLYELLTGTTPFDQDRFKAAECDEIRRIIREEDPPRPSTRIRKDEGGRMKDETGRARQTRWDWRAPFSSFIFHPSSFQELDWIVMKCLEKDRQRRYATANGLAADLQCYLRNENVQACPPSAWYQFSKFVQRNRRSVGIAAALGAVLLLAVVQLSVSNIQIRKEQDETAKALRDVTQARTDLKDALDREHRNAYFQRIARADLEWWAFNVGRADQILDDCPPEYRHWEWRYLKRLCHGDLATLRGHTQLVRAIVISPDGKRLASAGDDLSVKIWDFVSAKEAEAGDSPPASGSSPLTLHGHEQPVLSVAFSPDGRQVASAGGDWKSGKPGEVKIWDAATGEELRALVGNQGAVAGVAFSPDGQLVATAGWDGTLRLWDSKTGQKVGRMLHTASLKCVAFRPDGKQIACGGSDKVVTIWNVKNRQKIRTLSGHGSSVLSIAFSADGRRLVIGCWDHTARIWDVNNGRQLLVLRGHRHIVNGVAFSPDDNQIASVCGDSSVRLWDSQSGKELRTLRGHNGGVFGVAFSPGGRYLTTAGADNTVKLWELAADPQSRSFAWADSNQPRLAFSPDGKHLAAANRRLSTRKAPVRVRVFDSNSGKQTLALAEHPDGCHSVAYRHDGSQLVTDWGNQARIWDAKSGREIVTLLGHSGQVTAAAFSPDGEVVATASVDKTAKLWDAVTGKNIGTLAGHGSALTCISFRPIARKSDVKPLGKRCFLASGSKDHSVRVWDVKEQRGVVELFGHRAPVTDVVFSPDGGQLASSSEDGDIRIWDLSQVFLSTGKRETPGAKLMHVLSGRSGGVDSVAFSPEGKRLVSAHEDGTVTVWDVETGQEALSLRRQMMRAICVAFSPDGQRLIASGPPIGAGSGVTIWAAETVAKRDQVSLRQLLAQDARDGLYFKARATIASDADQAIALFSKALELGRDDAAVRSERGMQYAWKGKWPAAAADFAEAVRRQPDDARLWYWLAAAQLGGKDRVAYQATRAGIRERFGKTTDPSVAIHLLYISVTLPSASGETDVLVRLGKAAAPLFPGHERVLGAALFRHGDFQGALEQFDRSAKVFEPRAWDWFFRAMAHRKFGHAIEAQECHKAALAWIERANRSAAAGNRNAWISWYESVETSYLRDEATALLGVSKAVKR